MVETTEAKTRSVQLELYQGSGDNVLSSAPYPGAKFPKHSTVTRQKAGYDTIFSCSRSKTVIIALLKSVFYNVALKTHRHRAI
jgi:hypothetical protein